MKVNVTKRGYLSGLLAIVIILLWSHTQIAHAAPLINVPVTVTQPDGEELHIFASGDEYYNWLHDAQGYITEVRTKVRTSVSNKKPRRG